MIGAGGDARWVFEANEPVRVQLHYKATTRIETPVFSVLIHRDDGLYVTSSNTYQTDGMPPIEGVGRVEVEFPSIELARGSISSQPASTVSRIRLFGPIRPISTTGSTVFTSSPSASSTA